MMPEYSLSIAVDDYIHSFEISIMKQTTGENEASNLSLPGVWLYNTLLLAIPDIRER
jgi:hypothetical protein